MKKIYSYDNNKIFTDFDYYDDDYELKANQTTVPMPDGLYMPVAFDEDNNTWSGLTLGEFEKNNPANVNISPDENQLILNKVISMVAAQQVTINTIQAQLEKEK